MKYLFVQTEKNYWTQGYCKKIYPCFPG